MGILSYLAPNEVPVKQPTVLNGTFDPQQVTNLSVIAEDKYPLPVTLNPSAGTWQINLDRGFSSPGVRWLRLKGTNAANQTIADRMVYLTVSPQPMTEVDSLRLRVLQTTWFKVAPLNSGNLNNEQKVQVQAGQTLNVRRYAPAHGHLALELASPIEPVGVFGYFYQPHVQLSRQGQDFQFEEDELPTPTGGSILIWVRQNTKFKILPESSAVLSPSQQVELLAGQMLTAYGYACVDGHFRVTLAAPIPQFGDSGYLFREHVRLYDGEEWIEFDRNTFTITPLRTLPFKKRPLNASQLSNAEQVSLTSGRVYGVSSYALEDSHLQVALTENFPGFGNTGYVYLDFVQFKQGGQPFNLFPSLSYKGATEVLVGQPMVLHGTFDPGKAANVSLVAEDKHALPVNLDRDAGTWRVSLDKGFHGAGLRWLRLKSLDRNGASIGHQIIYITVSSDPLTVGESLTVRLRQDTLFKVAPVEEDSLSDRQKVTLRAGTTFEVLKYGFADGHLKVLLTYPVDPVGDFGYFYEPHVQLSKGEQELHFDIEDVPETPLAAGQMLVTQTTYLKSQPANSGSLPPTQKARLILGQTFNIRGYASISGHFRVTLAESVPGLGHVGYVFRNHVQLRQEGQLIAYDPEALTLTIRQGTVLKRRPVDTNKLSANEQTTLPTGRVYGVLSYKTESNHVKVTLTEELPGYGNTGYLFPDYVWMRRGSRTIDLFPPLPKYVELNVPYFSQRDNPRFSWSTCNVTSIAMVLHYYGVRQESVYPLEDDLLEWIFNSYGEGSQTDHQVLQRLIRAYGFETSFSMTRKWSDIDRELASGRPVVLAGDFIVPSGHIVTAIGYTPEGLIVNDPWGDGLSSYTDFDGMRRLYPNWYVDDKCGPDGKIWAHFITKKSSI